MILHPEGSWHDLPELPRAACALLDGGFVRSTSAVEQVQRSSDGSTAKLLLRLQDGLQVEAVVMTYDKAAPDGAAPHPTAATAVLL